MGCCSQYSHQRKRGSHLAFKMKKPVVSSIHFYCKFISDLSWFAVRIATGTRGFPCTTHAYAVQPLQLSRKLVCLCYRSYKLVFTHMHIRNPNQVPLFINWQLHSTSGGLLVPVAYARHSSTAPPTALPLLVRSQRLVLDMPGLLGKTKIRKSKPITTLSTSKVMT